MSVVSTLLTVLSAANHAPRASWCVLYDPLTEAESIRTCFTYGYASYVGNSKPWADGALQPFQGQPWRQQQRDIFTVARTWDSTLVLVCLEGEVARCAIVRWTNGLAGWSRTWKDHNRIIDEQNIWGRSMWIDFQVGRGCEDTWDVSCINVHQKLTSVIK